MVLPDLPPNTPVPRNRMAVQQPAPTFNIDDVPKRDPQAGRELVDLSKFYNSALTQAWHFSRSLVPNDLAPLPQGLQKLDGRSFDIRGVLQLHGVQASFRFPVAATGIPVGLKCRKLHFLHATGWMAKDGTEIGAYVLHYSDGQTNSLPIVYGDDVREWHGRSDTQSAIRRGRVAWQMPDDSRKRRLFHSSRDNPRPEVTVETIDFVSTGTDCFPFLVGLTVEP